MRSDEKDQERQILDSLKPRFASAAAARRWYETEPVAGFSGATAKELVRQARGDEVLDYIAAVDAGAFS